jgi:cyclophilin family peptidyl-prolyl cis-trans isomerase
MVLTPVIPTLATMTLTPTYTEIALPVGKTFQLPIDGSDTDAGTLNYSVSVNNSNVTATLSPTTNRSIEIDIDLNNDMVADGTLTLHLFDDLFGATRLTTDRIIELITSNFYDNLTFHRVIQNFVIQGGDPLGNGQGGSNIDFSDEYVAQLTFTGFGQLAMANSGDDSNDSQFFITDVDLGIANAPRPPQSLNFNHTIFGQLVEGFNIVAQIIASDGADAGEAPDTTIRMLDVRVINDTENAVVRLAPVGAAGTTSIVTVRATNTTTNLFTEQTFTVNVVADTDNGRATTETTNPGVVVDDRPFLNVTESAFPNIPSNLTTNEDTPIEVSATDLEATGNLTVRIVNTLPATATGTITTSNVANLSVTIDQVTREITLTPGPNFHGTLDFFLVVRDDTRRTDTNSDGQVTTADNIDALGNYDTQHIVLTVNVVNDAPTANSANGFFRNDGGTTMITLVATDGDPLTDAADVQTLMFEVVDAPDHGLVTISAAGVATYTPDGDFRGRETFTYRVMDNGGTANGGVDKSLPATVTLDFDAALATLRGGVLMLVGSAIDDDFDLAFVANAAGDDDDEVDVTLNGTDGGTFLFADITRISIQTLGGDDVITMDVEIATPSQIETGDGNDDVSSGDGDDMIDTGEGDDIVDAGNGENTILGRKGVDDLTGGDDADHIRGGKGDDSNLDGGDGDDNIGGGKGDDVMEGGEGDDHMFGNEGDDEMSGSEGDDMMKGGYGADDMDGGEGDDKMIGGPEFQNGGRVDGPDTMNGGEGDDKMRGGAGIDVIDGEEGRDTPRGGEGDDDITRDFMDKGIKGEAVFDRPGAPDIEDAHHDNNLTDDFYVTNGFTNPPTYGPHHFHQNSTGTGIGDATVPPGHVNGAPVQPTGIYDEQLPDVDMVHNLEHGHVWISYDPAQLSVEEVNRLKELVRDISGDPDGAGAGILLTQRAGNDDDKPIAVASWGRLISMKHVDAQAIRAFYDRNRGTAPEGFITP